jgi:hypothetical protein
MDEAQLEVFFCDLCNTSVPESDLASGRARRLHGKILGACCVDVVQGPTPPPGASGRSQLGAAVALLVAVAGAAVFLDWRLSDELGRTRGDVAGLVDSLRLQTDRMGMLERRLEATPTRADLDPLTREIGVAQGSARSAVEALDEPLRGLGRGIDAVAGTVAELKQATAGHAARFDRLDAEVQRLAGDLAEWKATPRVAAPAEPRAPTPAIDDGAIPAPTPSSEPQLPPELAHQVARLDDSDPGTRFEAVDKLVQSKHPLVLPALLRAVKDGDPFVRRLTVDGLAAFRKVETVDTLIDALADPESIVRLAAFVALKNVTGQKFAYEPDANRDDRLAGQRRWQDWWKNARTTF